MVDRRKKLHKNVMEKLREEYPMILRTSIAYSSEVEQMSVRRAPLSSYSPNSRAGRAYRELWGEIDRRPATESLGMLARSASIHAIGS
jgi:cellulose biosynthesis protein BcsQ